MKTILDFKRYDKVYGGIRNANENYIAYAKEMELVAAKVKIISRVAEEPELLFDTYQLGGGRESGYVFVIDSDNLHRGRIYLEREDFICDRNPIDLMYHRKKELLNYIYSKLGLSFRNAGSYLAPEFWRWDAEKRQAVMYAQFNFSFDLFDLRLPDGVYASREECERENKKVVNVKLTKVYDIEVDEEDLDFVTENPHRVDVDDMYLSAAKSEIVED